MKKRSIARRFLLNSVLMVSAFGNSSFAAELSDAKPLLGIREGSMITFSSPVSLPFSRNTVDFDPVGITDFDIPAHTILFSNGVAYTARELTNFSWEKRNSLLANGCLVEFSKDPSGADRTLSGSFRIRGTNANRDAVTIEFDRAGTEETDRHHAAPARITCTSSSGARPGITLADLKRNMGSELHVTPPSAQPASSDAEKPEASNSRDKSLPEAPLQSEPVWSSPWSWGAN